MWPDVRDHPCKTSADFHNFWPLTPSVDKFTNFWPAPPPYLRNTEILNGWFLIVVQLHKYLVQLCIRRRFDQFLSKRKLGPILYVRSRPGLSTIPAGPTELEAHCWHMLFPLTFIIRFKYCKKGTKLEKYPPFFVIMYLVTSKQRMSEL